MARLEGVDPLSFPGPRVQPAGSCSRREPRRSMRSNRLGAFYRWGARLVRHRQLRIASIAEERFETAARGVLRQEPVALARGDVGFFATTRRSTVRQKWPRCTLARARHVQGRCSEPDPAWREPYAQTLGGGRQQPRCTRRLGAGREPWRRTLPAREATRQASAAIAPALRRRPRQRLRGTGDCDAAASTKSAPLRPRSQREPADAAAPRRPAGTPSRRSVAPNKSGAPRAAGPAKEHDAQGGDQSMSRSKQVAIGRFTRTDVAMGEVGPGSLPDRAVTRRGRAFYLDAWRRSRVQCSQGH